MAVLDHVGVDHLVSKISEKIGDVESTASYAKVHVESVLSRVYEASDKAEEALKKPNNIEIWYTTSDGLVLTQGDNDTYKNGRGVLVVNPSATTLTYETLGFGNRSRLTSLVLPCNHFQSIANLMASAITGFTYFEVPDSVKTINVGTFMGSKFSEIKLGSGLKTIMGAAFTNSQTLEAIDIPDSVTALGGSAFVNCTSLKKVKLSSSLEEIYAVTFSGCTSLETIEIPDSITTIGASAFTDCSSLRMVKLGASLTGISDFTFSGCNSLESIEIPDSVTSIGTGAFYSCTNLKHIKIGSGVTSIGQRAFYNCSAKTSVEIHAITPPTLVGGMSAMPMNNGCKIYVPIESVDAYKSAQYWSNYAEVIVGVVFEDENIVPGEKLAKAPYVLPFAFDDVFQDEPENGSYVEYRMPPEDFANIREAVVNESSIILSCGHRFAELEADDNLYGGCLYATSSIIEDMVYLHFYDTYSSNNLDFEIGPEGDVNCRIYSTQPRLTSGENIKTVNGQSLLGSGDVEIAQPVYPYYLPVTMSEINNCLGNNSSGQIEYDYDTYYEEIKGAILSEQEIRIDNDMAGDGGFYISIDSQADDYIYITFASSEFIFNLSFEEGYVYVYRTEMASGNYVKRNFLPLSGGTVNGDLHVNGLDIIKYDDHHGIEADAIDLWGQEIHITAEGYGENDGEVTIDGNTIISGSLDATQLNVGGIFGKNMKIDNYGSMVSGTIEGGTW